jgi:hypothetical protein
MGGNEALAVTFSLRIGTDRRRESTREGLTNVGSRAAGITRATRSRMTPIRSFRDLEVWQRSMALVGLVIEATRELPRQEFDLRR